MAQTPDYDRVARFVAQALMAAKHEPGITSEEIMLGLSGMIASALCEATAPEDRPALMDRYIRTIRKAVEAGPVH